MDERCIEIMNELKSFAGEKLEIINGDALKINFAEQDIPPRNIVSNLPYNISVPLLTGWLKQIESFSSLTLMFQKEVADRICAPTNCKDYGRISVLAQLQCSIERLFDLNPNCFVPAPKIWSTVLLFKPLHAGIDNTELNKIEKITALAFGQRRKMIRQSLKSLPGIKEKLEQLQIPETYRAEQLTPKQYFELAKLL